MTATATRRGEDLTVHVDLRRAERNIERFHAAASERRVAVRAHVKGHRTVGLAVRQIESGACGVSVTQAGQAREYLEAGITDIVIAHPWRDAWRFPLFAELARDCVLAVHVDDPVVLGALGAAAREAGSTIGVLARIGDGYDATASSPARLLALARQARHTPGLRFDGLTSYQGMLAPADGRDGFDIGGRTARYAVRCAGYLRARGVPCRTVSVGGTPTAAGILSVPGVTELGSGAYALLDGGLVEAGICTGEDVALTVSLASGGEHDRAESLLAEHRYPWQRPGPALPAAGLPPAPVAAPHLCPLLQEVQVLHVRGLSGRVDRWPVLNLPDTAPPGAA
ncbi:D-serine deaminase-like pyridoxal phosphate-dependent protein [Streptacidiphilus sp. MAP12-20]|uniref:alanine racemase n=1 Tax=Streptacidiphilus sp. MAP12-20 TaxID=3156299 RepID=UPI003516A5AB